MKIIISSFDFFRKDPKDQRYFLTVLVRIFGMLTVGKTCNSAFGRLYWDVLRLLFTILGLLLLTACSPPPKVQRLDLPLITDHQVMEIKPGHYGGVFVETEPGEPKTFNFLLAEDNESMKYCGVFFQGLVTMNPLTQKIEPALAKSWDVSPDNKTYTFHLRDGLCWSDGRPLTADDVLFTFQCIFDARYPNQYSIELSVNGQPFTLKKIDNLTVQVQTASIFAPFLMKMGDALIVPQHILQPYFQDGTLEKCWTTFTAQKNPEAIVVSGPYKIHSFRPGERIVLQANPYFYQTDPLGHRLPYVDFLIKETVKDMNECTNSFAFGKTDALDSIDPNDAGWVGQSAKRFDCEVIDQGPSSRCNFIWFNQNPGKNKDGHPFVDPMKLRWFQDQRFRQAISYGIDRSGIVSGVLFGHGAPLWSFNPPSNAKWYNPNVQQYPYNPALALQLLQEAGFHRDGMILKDQQGHPVEFSLFTNHENQLRMNMATVFQENMRDLGINVKLQFIDFNAFIEKIEDSFDYEAGMLGFTGSPDPAEGVSILLSNGRMHQWYPSEPKPATDWEARIDVLMTAQLHTLDEAERKKDYDEVQLILSQQCPFIYLVTPNSYVGVRKKWQNLTPSIWDPHFWNPEQVWSLQ